MKLEALAYPGIIPNGQKLRIEALKAINYIQVVATRYPDGKVDHATQLSAFFDACKEAIADNVPEAS